MRVPVSSVVTTMCATRSARASYPLAVSAIATMDLPFPAEAHIFVHEDRVEALIVVHHRGESVEVTIARTPGTLWVEGVFFTGESVEEWEQAAAYAREKLIEYGEEIA